MKFTFEKDLDNRWYVILPDYTGERGDLEMVDGADTLLDLLSGDKNNITLSIEIEEPEFYEAKMSLIKYDNNIDNELGRYYEVSLYCGGFTAWLCPVTLFVFGFYPENIFINK